MNASSTCGLVGRIIYCDEMIASSKGSHCLNAGMPLQSRDIDLDLDLNLEHLSEKWDEESLPQHGDHLSFECLDLFRCDEDLLDLGYELLLDHDRCLHLSSLLGDLD